VKKFLLFFIFISLFGCESYRNKEKVNSNIDCPMVFFSSENRVYAGEDAKNLEIENIDFKASLNNYKLENCYEDTGFYHYSLSLLLLVEPINPSDNKISLPFFVHLYDSQDKIVDKQYFIVSDSLNYSYENTSYQTLEIVSSLELLIENSKKVKTITVGFVKIN
tara:strand:+ start:265 stop:756 length:492 start_codon:yes stop_codon:yes gene_type:complete